MAFAVPEHSRGRVDRAGAALALVDIPAEELRQVMPVISNWRAAHAYPLNTFQATLRNKLQRLGVAQPLVGQRLKRLPSIATKLQRNPSMRLQQMQDIAGLRAVLPSMGRLRHVLGDYRLSRFSHELRGVDDYVAMPKDDGYRSIHLKYRYFNEKAPEYEGLNVEIQLRTRLQHAWATAVETVDLFTGQAIKAGRPSANWSEFFQLASGAIALDERCPTPERFADMSSDQLLNRLFTIEQSLKVRTRLRGYSAAVERLNRHERANAAYHLITLNTVDRKVNIESFSHAEQDMALMMYSIIEERAAHGAPLDTVLVAGGSVQQLKKSYPNYFLDASSFVSLLDRLAEEVGAPIDKPRPTRGQQNRTG